MSKVSAHSPQMPLYSADPNAISPYLSDEAAAFVGNAERVYFPTNASEVAEIVREATRLGTGVTVSGGGTSLTGARVPTTGGWILATDRITAVADADPDGKGDNENWKQVSAGDGFILLDAGRLRARVPAGIRLGELDVALAPHGLFYPPTLTETTAMIGGTIATNASGARSFHYGSTRAWIEGLRVVTARGEVHDLRRGQPTARDGRLAIGHGDPINLPRVAHPDGVKNAAGYYVEPAMEPIDLFIGGEGTLGVVVEAEVRLAPRRSTAVTLIAYMHERDAALDLADTIRSGALDPSVALAIEYFDGNSLEFMRESYPEIPPAAAAVLVEVAPPEGEEQGWYENPQAVSQWLATIGAMDPVDVWAVLPTESELVRLFRHSLPDRVNDYVRTRGGKLGTDFAVPAENFRALIAAYDKVAESGIRSVLFGHLGEYHLHLNFLAEDAAELDSAHDLYTGLARTAVELGGTVSAEHGVGKKRIRVAPEVTLPYLEVMYGPEGMHQLRGLKEQLDPAWVLNRDTMIPWRDEA